MYKFSVHFEDTKMVDHILKISRPGVFDIIKVEYCNHNCLWNYAAWSEDDIKVVTEFSCLLGHPVYFGGPTPQFQPENYAGETLQQHNPDENNHLILSFIDVLWPKYIYFNIYFKERFLQVKTDQREVKIWEQFFTWIAITLKLNFYVENILIHLDNVHAFWKQNS